MFFHRWDWLALMARALDAYFLPLGCYHSGTLVGLAPLLVKQYGPYKSANWVPFPYLGLLVPRALLAEAMQALDHYQDRNGISLVQLGFAPDAGVDVHILEQLGYAIRTDTTMVVPLAGRSEDEVWAALQSRGRASVRRARRASVEVRTAREYDITRELPAIMQEVFEARQMPPTYPRAAAEAVWDAYYADTDLRMAVAQCGTETAAVLITTIDRGRATMWEGGSRRLYRSANPNALLYWDAICWARNRGCSHIDLLGNPDQGVAMFKESFGGTTMSYVVANRVNSRLAAWARRAHTHAGRVLLLPSRFGRARQLPSSD